jgi:hypothetical protein
MHLQVGDFSVKKLILPQSGEIDGFKIGLDANLKPNDSFKRNYKKDPGAYVKNLDIDAQLHFSKPFYALLNRAYPLDIMFANYKKEDAKGVKFHIELHNGVVKINDKTLR